MSESQYHEIFSVEIDGWCYGLSQYPGEKHPALIHRVVREMQGSFAKAIEQHVYFNVLDISSKIAEAGKFTVSESEIAFAILTYLPNPKLFDLDGQYIIANIVDQVEQVYGGALDQLQKKWNWEHTQVRAKDAA